MENTHAIRQIPTLRKVAKKVAKDRRALNFRHFRLQQLVREEFAPMTSNRGSLVGAAPPTPESPPLTKVDAATTPLVDPMRDLSLFPQGHPKHETHGEITMGTMSQVAEDIYKLAAINFDEMDLSERMKCMLTDMKEKNQLETEVLDTLVTRDFVLTALHRNESAKKDFGAFISKQAALANLPKNLDPSFQPCKNCGDRFHFQPPVDTYGRRLASAEHVHAGECRYHPGALRCYNDEIIRTGEPLKEKFLTHGRVKMHEFQLMIYECYWDCCGAKLVAPGPDAGARTKKNKHMPLQVWEIREEGDGDVGCQVLRHHIKADEFHLV